LSKIIQTIIFEYFLEVESEEYFNTYQGYFRLLSNSRVHTTPHGELTARDFTDAEIAYTTTRPANGSDGLFTRPAPQISQANRRMTHESTKKS